MTKTIRTKDIRIDIYEDEWEKGKFHTYFDWVGKWSLGTINFNGANITLPKDSLCYISPWGCCDKHMDEEDKINRDTSDLYTCDSIKESIGHYTMNSCSCVLSYESIDEILSVLDGNVPNTIVNESDYKEYCDRAITKDALSYGTDDLEDYGYFCDIAIELLQGKFKGVMLDEGQDIMLLKNIEEVIKELRQVNDIAKENNVTFKWI